MTFPDCYPLIIKIGKGELLPRNSVLIKYFRENDSRAWILYDVNICENLSEEDLISIINDLNGWRKN